MKMRTTSRKDGQGIKKFPMKQQRKRKIKQPTRREESPQPGTSGMTNGPPPPSASKTTVVPATRYDITAMDIPVEARRPVICDGENLAYDDITERYIAERILSAVAWFEGIGHQVLVAVPEYLHNMLDTPTLLADLANRGQLELVPCTHTGRGTNYDFEVALLQRARDTEAAVVSERSFLSSYSSFSEIVLERVTGFCFYRNQIFIPVDPYGRAGPWLRVILRKS